MFDPMSDSSEFLYQKIGSALDEGFVEELRKEAALCGPEGFADPSRRAFPIFSEKAAAASATYASYQELPPSVEERIKEALDLYGIEVEIPQVKEASAPDPDDYLFPQQHKVLVSNVDQVKTAEVLLREHREHMDIPTRTFAYRRLQEKAAEYGLSLGEDSLRYCADSRCHVPSLCNALQRRRGFVCDGEVKEAYAHLEYQLRSTKLAHIDDEEEKDKLAQLVYELDEAADITARYNRPGELGFPDAVLSVFNTDKTAADYIDMAGKEVPIDQIAGLDPESIGDIVGSEFVEDIVGPDGEVDPHEMAQTLSILPSDMQQEIVQRLSL